MDLDITYVYWDWLPTGLYIVFLLHSNIIYQYIAFNLRTFDLMKYF